MWKKRRQRCAGTSHASAILIAVIKLLTEVTQRKKGLYTHTVEGKALHLGCEAADRVTSAVRKQSRMKVGIQLAFSILFGQRPQNIGWCHPRSVKPRYEHSRIHTQMPVPMVILNPLPLTRTTAYVCININISASKGWKYSLVIECVLNVCKVLGPVPRIHIHACSHKC